MTLAGLLAKKRNNVMTNDENILKKLLWLAETILCMDTIHLGTFINGSKSNLENMNKSSLASEVYRNTMDVTIEDTILYLLSKVFFLYSFHC